MIKFVNWEEANECAQCGAESIQRRAYALPESGETWICHTCAFRLKLPVALAVKAIRLPNA